MHPCLVRVVRFNLTQMYRILQIVGSGDRWVLCVCPQGDPIQSVCTAKDQHQRLSRDRHSSQLPGARSGCHYSER
jgi:hypothetical protein